MIKEIVTDVRILEMKCKPCFFTDMDVLHNQLIIKDMLDTAAKNKENCLGLAANQIGEYRRIILAEILLDGIRQFVVMVNPSFTPVKTAGMKRFKEGCLSFPQRMFVNRVIKRRYKKVNLTYHLVTGKKEKIALSGIEAIIVQHEIDHLNGILI